MGLHEKIAKLGNNLKSVIQSIIDPQQMRELARETGFIKRCSSRLKGDEFVQLLIVESVDGEKNTLRGAIDTLRQIKSTALMTTQALCQRINTKAAAELIESVFTISLQVVMDQINKVIVSENSLELLKSFSKVYVQDSSECQLDEALKNEYKGSGGGSGNGIGDASVKIDLIYEYKAKILSYFKVTDRREPDTSLGEKIVEIIKKGDLVIRDLGYSSINVFKQIHEIGAYFLSRLHPSLSVYLNPNNDTQPVLLGNFLEKKAKKSGMANVMVYISKQMLHCRMIAYRVPPEIKNKRREEYLKECKKRKRKPNKEYIKRLSFTIFITNVPATVWSTEVIGTIYRLRWQVELIFKSWKSNLKFDFLDGKKAYRIKCLIFARLTAILMMFTVYTFIDKVTLELLEKEVSIHKVIDWFTKHGRFFKLVINGFCKSLWMSLIEDSKYILCKEKRKCRKTTRELIENMIPFGVATC